MLVGVLDDNLYNPGNFHTIKTSSRVRESERIPWVTKIPVVDQRDAMHKRGWTYFRITGQIDGRRAQGIGQIPFVYDAAYEHPSWQIDRNSDWVWEAGYVSSVCGASQKHPPWLRLNIADTLEIVDSPSGAHSARPDGTVIATYPAGSFFKGLGQPWMGLHTIDAIRRDAANRRTRFETQEIKDEKVQIRLMEAPGYPQVQVIYEIHMTRDLIEKIEFLTYGSGEREKIGELKFTYVEDVEQAASEMVQPEIERLAETEQKSMGILWLMGLAQGTLGQ